MLINAKVIGSREVHYTRKTDGRPVNGRNIYYVFEDENVTGQAADSLYVSDGNNNVPILVPGDKITVFHARVNGQVAKEFVSINK